jgi:hypothetical protein
MDNIFKIEIYFNLVKINKKIIKVKLYIEYLEDKIIFNIQFYSNSLI